MKTREMDHLIIGAGPAGLAIAGRMRHRGIAFDIVEKGNHVGESWHRHYDRLCLHTVNELSHLPHRPFPKHYPQYVTRDQLIDYLEDYAKTYQIRPNFSVAATSIKRNRSGWKVRMDGGMSFQCKRVVIATGLNRVPFYPTWDGMETYEGSIIHSTLYKNSSSIQADKVLVIGMGNTGAEVALDLAEEGIPVSLSVRSTVNIVPREVAGRPTQLTGRMLSKLPFGLGDVLGSWVSRLVLGDLSKYGLKRSPLSPAEQLRKTGKTPVIDLGTVAKIREGAIKVKPDIAHFEATEVIYANGESEKIDLVILATGYLPQLSDLLDDTEGLLDEHQVPKQPIGTGKYEGLYFVGFNPYKLGGILRTIHTDSNLIVDHIEGR